jgi:hypothetical protein
VSVIAACVSNAADLVWCQGLALRQPGWDDSERHCAVRKHLPFLPGHQLCGDHVSALPSIWFANLQLVWAL